METNFNISIILPVNSSKVKDFSDFFGKAIESIKNQLVKVNELVIVHTDEEALIEFLNGFDFSDLNVKKVLNTGKSD